MPVENGMVQLSRPVLDHDLYVLTVDIVGENGMHATTNRLRWKMMKRLCRRTRLFPTNHGQCTHVDRDLCAATPRGRLELSSLAKFRKR